MSLPDIFNKNYDDFIKVSLNFFFSHSTKKCQSLLLYSHRWLGVPFSFLLCPTALQIHHCIVKLSQRKFFCDFFLTNIDDRHHDDNDRFDKANHLVVMVIFQSKIIFRTFWLPMFGQFFPYFFFNVQNLTNFLFMSTNVWPMMTCWSYKYFSETKMEKKYFERILLCSVFDFFLLVILNEMSKKNLRWLTVGHSVSQSDNQSQK